jgi:hypothetical protein
MYFVSFIVFAVFIVIAACFWGRGLVRLHQGDEKAKDYISRGHMVGVWGVVITAILYGFFSL